MGASVASYSHTMLLLLLLLPSLVISSSPNSFSYSVDHPSQGLSYGHEQIELSGELHGAYRALLPGVRAPRHIHQYNHPFQHMEHRLPKETYVKYIIVLQHRGRDFVESGRKIFSMDKMWFNPLGQTDLQHQSGN